MAAPRPPPARLSGVMVPAPIQDLEALRALTALFKEQRNRETAPRTIFQRVLDILKKSSRAVELACREPAQVDHLAASLQLITECFRCLRNACIECSVNQNSIRNLDTIGVAVDLILLFRELRVEQESLLTAFRCGLQFLGNIASRNEASQRVVWMHAFPELFLSCLNHPDKKIVAYSSMILFTSLSSERMKELEENLNIAIDVVEAHRKQPESEWPFLIITDHFLKSPELVKAMYAKMSNQERVALLDLTIAKIAGEEPLTKDDVPVFLSHAELVASAFVDQCRAVLHLTAEQPTGDEEALATIRLLDVLCEMTANTDLLGYLQVFPGLLERVIDLLRLIHAAGSDTTSIFSPCASIKAEGDITNVAEGFKSHLIRLIGNLCYKNKENQDKSDVIQLPSSASCHPSHMQFRDRRQRRGSESTGCDEMSRTRIPLWLFPKLCHLSCAGPQGLTLARRDDVRLEDVTLCGRSPVLLRVESTPPACPQPYAACMNSQHGENSGTLK